MTANQIAGVLGDGITRNAVIGKVHRLGLSASDKMTSKIATSGSDDSPPTADRLGAQEDLKPHDPPKSMRANHSSSGANERAGVVSVNVQFPSARSAVTISELTDTMCRWPVDDPCGELRYCGHTASGAAPYCAAHCKLAYQPTKPVRRHADRQNLFPSVVFTVEDDQKS